MSETKIIEHMHIDLEELKRDMAVVKRMRSLLVAHEYFEWLIFNAMFPNGKNQSLRFGRSLEVGVVS